LTEGEGAILLKEEPLRERERELRDYIAPIAAERKAALDRLAAFIVENPSGSAIAKRIESDARTEAEWRSGAAERLAAIRAQIASARSTVPWTLRIGRPAERARKRPSLALDGRMDQSQQRFSGHDCRAANLAT
jgi:hypothetical protein